LGVGAALLREVFRIARSQQCKRVRWQVLNWNEPAIRLYARAGADIDSTWLNCSYDEEGIKDFSM
jgi:RimJ/RimL family protein N-acetyltransferase